MSMGCSARLSGHGVLKAPNLFARVLCRSCLRFCVDCLVGNKPYVQLRRQIKPFNTISSHSPPISSQAHYIYKEAKNRAKTSTMAFENIPSVQVYRPPPAEDHHDNESISHSSTSSINSTSDPSMDDRTNLLDKAHHEPTHTRNFSTDSAVANQDTDQNRSLLNHDQLSRETETPVEKENSRPCPPHVAQPNPNPYPTPVTTGVGLPAQSRPIPRYYSYFRGSTGCGKGTPENEYEYDVEGEPRHGFHTGLPLWKSWTNARTEWRVGSRARVLKYYVGCPALGLLIVAVVVVIVVVVVGAVRVAYV